MRQDVLTVLSLVLLLLRLLAQVCAFRRSVVSQYERCGGGKEI